MGRFLILLVLVSVVMSETSNSEKKKVLLLPLPVKSHVFSFTAIGEELVRQGFVVHLFIIESFPLSSELASNKSGISIIRYPDRRSEAMDYDAFFTNYVKPATEGAKVSMPELISNLISFAQSETQNLLVRNDRLMEVMTEFKYDIAIVDSVMFAKYLHLIPIRLGIPWVTYSDLLNSYLINVPWLPSFYASKVTPHFGKMTFIERLMKTMLYAFLFGYPIFPDPPEEILAVYRQYGAFTSLDDLVSRSLLFITTFDLALDDPLPSLPNMIHAGGLTTKPVRSKPLPEEFDHFITAAKSGIVVVSFGTMVSSFPAPIAEKFIAAFSSLPDLHFIWRFKNTDHLIIPKNVMIADWLPQNDLLAHSRTKLFITHCGNNGQFEAVFHGVPMIGFPLVSDQEHNAKRLDHRRYGISMSINDFTTEALLANIREILTDPEYKKRVSLASEIFRSARRSPAERVVDGIDHVLRFGSDHLRPAGSDLPLYQYLMLDVLAFFALVLIVIALLIKKFVCFLFRRMTRVSDKTKSE